MWWPFRKHQNGERQQLLEELQSLRDDIAFGLGMTAAQYALLIGIARYLENVHLEQILSEVKTTLGTGAVYMPKFGTDSESKEYAEGSALILLKFAESFRRPINSN